MKWILATPVLAVVSSVAPASGNPYFPASFKNRTVSCNFESRDAIATISALENDWYSGQLTAAKESSLYLASIHPPRRSGRTLRFTWLRSFHAPVVIGIDGLGTRNSRLVAKQLSGKGGYAPGSISKQLDRQLSLKEEKAVELALARTQVLNLPPKLCDMGLDGAEWIIEAVDGKGYHFVERWSPESGGVRDLGIALLGLTGWEFKPIY